MAPVHSFKLAPRRASRPRLSRRLLLLVILIAAFSRSFGATFGTRHQFSMPDEDPYKVLGIHLKDQNNMDAIKKAYRELAKKAHPDKNPHLDPKIANQRFHRINNAYEYLSNKEQKKYYDARRRNKSRSNNSNTNNAYRKQQEEKKRKQRQQQQKKQQRQRAREQEKIRKAEEEKRKREIKKLAREAQANLLKVTTLEDLFRHNIVNQKTQVFEKNFLCVFVSNKKLENVADNEYLFPYPFVPKGGPDNSDWESVIQTAKVRFNKPTPLTKYFNVPSHKLSQPYIIFVEEGTRFDKLRNKMYHTGGKHSHEKFENWVLDQLQTTITLINRNPTGGSHIRPYVIVSGKKTTMMTVLKAAGQPLAPGYMMEIPAKLFDRIIILDESTNEFVGSSSAIRQSLLELDEAVVDLIAMDDVIVLEKGQTINVGAGHGTTRSCYDLSTTCQTWLSQEDNKCQRFPAFAHSMCAKSCGVCIDSPRFNGLYYAFLHAPTTKIPNGVLKTIFLAIREVAKFLEVVGHDFLHLWLIRRTVLAVFLVGGFMLGIQIDLSILMILEKSSAVASAGKRNHQPSLLVLGFWFFSSAFVASLLFYVYKATTVSDLFHSNGLISFHQDLVNIRKNSPEIAAIFLCVGIGSLLVSKLLTYPLIRRPGLDLFGHMVFLATAVIISFLMIVGLSLNFEQRARISSYMLRINIQWVKALKYYKNVAATMILLGHMVGNTALIFLSYIGYKLSSRKSVHLIASLANVFAACLLASLVLRDPYFLQDFEHVTSMRMSAAIPCLVMGVVLGITCSFRFFSKTSVTSVSKGGKAMQNPREILKEKVH